MKQSIDTHYRTIIEHSREAVIILQQCQIKYANPAAATIFDFPVEALIGLDFSGFSPFDDPQKATRDVCFFAESVQSGNCELPTIRIVDGAGVEKVLEVRLVPMIWEAESALLCYIVDITGKMEAEAALQEREAIFNALINQAYNGIVVIQNDCLVYLNEQMSEILGYTVEEMLNTKLAHYVHPDEISKVYDFYTRRMMGEEVPRRYESRLVHKNGRFLDVQFNADVVPYQGQPADLVFVRDITERKRRQAALERQNRELNTQARQVDQIISSVPDGVLLLDGQKRLIMANPAAHRYLPLLADMKFGETLVHLGERPLSELLVPPPRGLWHEVVSNGQHFDVIARAIETKPSGGWVMVIHDITREKEVKSHLQQQTRLAAVGQLAAGIAHDFNNIMTIISLYTNLIERTEEQLSPNAQKRLEIIAQQSNRAADLIEQILDFSRRSMLERLPMDFLPFLKEVIKLLDRTLIENIHITLAYEKGDYVINADPTRMQQMLMNLAVNARDAMFNGGELSFALSLLSVNGEVNDLGVDLEPGNWIQLRISDNGTGIESDVLPHIFDPFFTTKAPGHGSGLGLAQVWGIVTQHEGDISVTTVEDRGTTFTLYFPLFEQGSPVAYSDAAFDVSDGSKEAVLVVEDNVMTREAVVDSLYSLNYEVITAVHGLDALAIMKDQGDRIRLIISDVVMPEMGGISLLKTLRDGGWETAVLLLTGHPLQKELDEAISCPAVEWLPKPVTLEQLAETVERCLEAKTVNSY